MRDSDSISSDFISVVRQIREGRGELEYRDQEVDNRPGAIQQDLVPLMSQSEPEWACAFVVFFADTVQDRPKGSLKTLFEEYLDTLQMFDAEDWKRFSPLMKGEVKPSELAGRTRAFVQQMPADHAMTLALRIAERDRSWFQRSKRHLGRVLVWVVGLPVVGAVVDWVFSNWEIIISLLPGAGVAPSGVSPSELIGFAEYAALAGIGAGVIGLLALRRLFED